jgi:hypothetical protein
MQLNLKSFGRALNSAMLGMSLCFALSLPSAAGDWSIEARTTHRADAENRSGSNQDNDGYVLGLLNTIYADAIYQTDNSKLDLIGDLTYRTRWDDADGDDIDDSWTPELRAKYNINTKQTITELDAYWNRNEVRYIDVTDPFFDTSNAYRDMLRATGSHTYKLDARNAVGVRGSFSHTDFDETSATLVPRIETSAAVFWTRRMTKRSDLTNTISFSNIMLDDAVDTRRNTISFQTNLATKLSPQLLVRLGGGANVVASHEDEVSASPHDNEWTDFGWTAEAGFDYAYKRGRVLASANYGSDTNGSGEFVDRLTLQALATRELNERSGLEASANARFSDIGQDDEQWAFDASTAFAHRLTDDWRMRLGYRYTRLENDAGASYSNNLFLSFTQDWVVQP